MLGPIPNGVAFASKIMGLPKSGCLKISASIPGCVCSRLSLTARKAFTSDAVLKVKPGLYRAGASLGNLKALKELTLTSVVFGYAYPIPPQLGSLPALLSLYIVGTQFIGPIPAELGKLKMLQQMNMNDNRFPDGILDAFGDLQALTFLGVGANQMRKVGSQRNTLLKKLESFDINSNLLSGPIPTWFGQLSLSGFIDLGQNRFSGPIPGELCNMRGLKIIYLYMNQVTAIPPQIGNCASLTDLVLFENKIEGKLLAELVKLKKLLRFSVMENQLTGTLPPSIGDLPLLTECDVGHNKLKGTIPANYGPFEEDALRTDFSGNMFTGSIPAPLNNMRVEVFRPGNPELCGKPRSACI